MQCNDWEINMKSYEIKALSIISILTKLLLPFYKALNFLTNKVNQ